MITLLDLINKVANTVSVNVPPCDIAKGHKLVSKRVHNTIDPWQLGRRLPQRKEAVDVIRDATDVNMKSIRMRRIFRAKRRSVPFTVMKSGSFGSRGAGYGGINGFNSLVNVGLNNLNRPRQTMGNALGVALNNRPKTPIAPATPAVSSSSPSIYYSHSDPNDGLSFMRRSRNSYDAYNSRVNSMTPGQRAKSIAMAIGRGAAEIGTFAAMGGLSMAPRMLAGPLVANRVGSKLEEDFNPGPGFFERAKYGVNPMNWMFAAQDASQANKTMGIADAKNKQIYDKWISMGRSDIAQRDYPHLYAASHQRTNYSGYGALGS